MTTVSWVLLDIVIYLIIGVLLKNHTRIGTDLFKNFGIRFIIFYIFPLGGLFFYMIAGLIYALMKLLSIGIFDDAIIEPTDFFVDPAWPKYPSK